MDIAHLRKEYNREGLSEDTVPRNPFSLFETWFTHALEAKLIEPNAMTLATVDAELQPNARTVLLKIFDEKGFVFFTNYESQKGQEIAQNPRVSLLFPWLALERQVKIRGEAHKISKAESLKYFLSRPAGSQLGAWVSEQSKVISSRKILEMKLTEMKQKFSDGKVPLPSSWGGYRVVPHAFEFWQGGENRLHDRIAYRAKASDAQEWTIQRLAP